MDITAAIALLSLALALAAAAGVLALARQLGLLLARVGPDRARPTADGPDLDDNLVDLVTMPDVTATLRPFGSAKRPGTLLVFTKMGCGLCESLVEHLRSFAKAYKDLDIRVLNEGVIALDASPWRRISRVSNVLLFEKVEHMRFGVTGSPYAVLLNSDGRVVSKGIVNSIPQIESLLSVEFVVKRNTLIDDGSTVLSAR